MNISLKSEVNRKKKLKEFLEPIVLGQDIDWEVQTELLRIISECNVIIKHFSNAIELAMIGGREKQ